MGADATITITGKIQSAEDFERLVKAIRRSAPTVEWSDAMGLSDEDEIREHLAYVMEKGYALDFMENDRHNCEFRAIQDACREIGLSYVLDVDVDPRESVPGNMEVWTPGMEAPQKFLGSEQAGGPFLSAKELLPLVEEGRLDEVARLVRLSANPAADLPKTLSVAFDLELTQAATP